MPNMSHCCQITRSIRDLRDKWELLNLTLTEEIQEGLAVANIARDDPSTLPGDDPSPRARMHRDRNAR